MNLINHLSETIERKSKTNRKISENIKNDNEGNKE